MEPGPMDTPFFYPQEAPEAVRVPQGQWYGQPVDDDDDAGYCSSGPVLVH
ncbi:hypothetical protein PENANT_c023G09251 [Penicillium antarcticum]|uniref:Uncharacterized protein n=1 Tax=Penicillium antarcticum TaxID=416450 RepID=A0A1V6PYS7_9EURO|nr:hypothetical protein PENANT_c023G09251 [Penicillium antarcticum]